MKPFVLLLAAPCALAFLLPSAIRADWPQWRGPERNGVVPDAPPFPAEFAEGYAPEKIWEVEGIPSDHYGGHGSVSIADGRVYLSVVWHRDEPTETRRINSEAMSALGYRGTNSLPDGVVEKMEHERMNLPRRLRGAALEEFAQNWVEEHLDEKTQLSLGGWIISRFRKGTAAIPIAVYEQLREARDLEFAGQQELEEWVQAQGFEPHIAEQIIEAVPNTVKKADDVVLCLDAATGEELWKFEVPGYPSGRASSSTPAVAGGKVYAALSEHLYCLDAAGGSEVWRTPLEGRKGPASSPLVVEGKVFLQENRLTAFDAGTGEVLWVNREVRRSNPSPAWWKGLVLCNGSREVFAIDAETGETRWKVPGGGDATPVIEDDIAIVHSRLEGKNLIAYRLSQTGAEELWSKDYLARRYDASPVIQGGNVYHLGSNRHLCVDLETGETRWDMPAQSSISSPIVAGDRLLVYENRGGFLGMIKADPADYTHQGRAKVGGLYCASPAIVGDRLYLRTSDSVACFRFP